MYQFCYVNHVLVGIGGIVGIGRYCGIKTLTKNGLKKDYLQIEYKENSCYIVNRYGRNK